MFIDWQIQTPERYYEISASGKKEGRTQRKGDFWIVVETWTDHEARFVEGDNDADVEPVGFSYDVKYCV